MEACLTRKSLLANFIAMFFVEWQAVSSRSILLFFISYKFFYPLWQPRAPSIDPVRPLSVRFRRGSVQKVGGPDSAAHGCLACPSLTLGPRLLQYLHVVPAGNMDHNGPWPNCKGSRSFPGPQRYNSRLILFAIVRELNAVLLPPRFYFISIISIAVLLIFCKNSL